MNYNDNLIYDIYVELLKLMNYVNEHYVENKETQRLHNHRRSSVFHALELVIVAFVY